MKKLTFITGGARSGKSRFAQKLALEHSPDPVYVATARIWDKEFQDRVDRHRHERDHRWTTMEEEKQLSRLPLAGRTAVIDCVTLWITNFFSDSGYDIDACFASFKTEIDSLLGQEAYLIVISNEIGMGLHADTEVGRKFTDLQGWVNQYLASRADRVIFMISGIPLTVK
ncbi:MAG TPA: bifunctional adenosylcobinamide kinase/adenosylcobinamide-phosphate guanylyltransferase [Puia sp.]|jgi:adenosylcobinamide kinase/adenosylcobinamide-phosphate guanylyltransferase|nr:bifunctional adenosylcobinamide kinase/adenosylcobinamide-phosphate guanylyltransferase [Puia sp.]